jgi:hypothetical protein
VKTIGAILVLALAVVIYGQLNMRSLRFAGIVQARNCLKTANEDLAKSGSVTNYGNYYKVWVSTNIVNVNGTNYGCKLMVQVHKFYNEGTLAQTTNDLLIWLGNGQPPKLITADYRPRLFPPGF